MVKNQILLLFHDEPRNGHKVLGGSKDGTGYGFMTGVGMGKTCN